MALLAEVNTVPLTSTENKLTCNSPVKYSAIGAIIDEQHTDILISEYQDRIFIVLSQYKKLGALITVCKESARAGDENSVFKVRTLLGQDNIDQDVAARYIAEQTLMNKPALFSICLKSNNFKTLEAIKDIILANKSW